MNWCVERDWGKKVTTEEEKSLRQLDKIRKETKVKLLQLSIYFFFTFTSAFGCREQAGTPPWLFLTCLVFSLCSFPHVTSTSLFPL